MAKNIIFTTMVVTPPFSSYIRFVQLPMSKKKHPKLVFRTLPRNPKANSDLDGPSSQHTRASSKHVLQLRVPTLNPIPNTATILYSDTRVTQHLGLSWVPGSLEGL